MRIADDNNLANTEVLNLTDLKQGSIGITQAVGESFAEAAAVCLEKQGHLSGISMKVDGSFNEVCQVVWEKTTEQMKRCHADLQYATELGAYGIAALLVVMLTDFRIVRRSCKGTGFDYWLGNENNTGTLFQNKCRLEVSGILKGNKNIPEMLFIVEFGNPYSKVVNK